MRKTTLLAALAPMVLGGLSAPALAQDWNHNDRSVERHNNDGRGYDNRGPDNRGFDNRANDNRGWQMTPQRNAMIRADIDQLDIAINRAQQRRTLSPREAAGLRMQARDVKRMYFGYARDGLNRNEVIALEQRVNQIRGRLQMERRDWNNWRG
jgi:hypothetical protein